MDPKTQERTESKLVGLHTSGLPAFVFQSLRKKGIILPKWNIRVSYNEEKIDHHFVYISIRVSKVVADHDDLLTQSRYIYSQVPNK